MEVFDVTAAALYMACVVSYISAGLLHVRPCPKCPEYVPRSTMPWEGRSPCHLQVGCVGSKLQENREGNKNRQGIRTIGGIV